MSWHSWCCHENGDTLGWHTESLRPCWYKLYRGCSCAVGSNTRPHLEGKAGGMSEWEVGRETHQTDSLLPGYHSLSRGRSGSLFSFSALQDLKVPSSRRGFGHSFHWHMSKASGVQMKWGLQPQLQKAENKATWTLTATMNFKGLADMQKCKMQTIKCVALQWWKTWRLRCKTSQELIKTGEETTLHRSALRMSMCRGKSMQ